MRAGAKPPFQKVAQFARRLQPEIGCSRARLIPNENAQSVSPVTSVIFDGAEGSFIGEVIAQKSSGNPLAMQVRASGLSENRHDSFTFVAAGAQFESSLEFEQAKAVHLRKRFEENARLLLDHSGASRRSTAPVHDDGVRFFFDQAAAQGAGCVALELRSQHIELGAGSRRDLFELAAAVRMQPLGAVQTPDLRRGFHSEQWKDFSGRPARDDDDARTALGLDLIQEGAHAGPGKSLESVDTEWRKRPVIVQQQ